MNKKEKILTQSGQALIMLLVFTTIAIITISAAVALTIITRQNAAKVANSEESLHYAEAGADEAILKVIKDPSYTVTGQVLTIGLGSARVDVTGAANNKTIVSEGLGPGHRRKIQVIGTYANGVFTINSWQEIN